MNGSLNKQPTSDITATLRLLRPKMFNLIQIFFNITSLDLIYDPVNVFVSKPRRATVQQQTNRDTVGDCEVLQTQFLQLTCRLQTFSVLLPLLAVLLLN